VDTKYLIYVENCKYIIDHAGGCRKIGCQDCPLNRNFKGCEYATPMEINVACIDWLKKNE